jgi:hypothetical protein
MSTAERASLEAPIPVQFPLEDSVLLLCHQRPSSLKSQCRRQVSYATKLILNNFVQEFLQVC